eukprot:1032427-Rhodomonas_salina.1
MHRDFGFLHLSCTGNLGLLCLISQRASERERERERERADVSWRASRREGGGGEGGGGEGEGEGEGGEGGQGQGQGRREGERKAHAGHKAWCVSCLSATRIMLRDWLYAPTRSRIARVP